MRRSIPSIRELMEDPVYRAYMKRVPPAHHANTTGEPWQIWVRTESAKWLTRTYPRYRDVWPVFTSKYRDHTNVSDVTITSRRVFYAPPGEWYDQKVRKARRPTPDNPKTSHVVVERRWRQTFQWEIGLEWCGRCRRPVHWIPLYEDHHALRKRPAVTEDENIRCVICAIRWCATPDIDLMERLP